MRVVYRADSGSSYMPDEEEESGANRSANTPVLLTSQNLFSISQISQISQNPKKVYDRHGHSLHVLSNSAEPCQTHLPPNVKARHKKSRAAAGEDEPLWPVAL